MKRILSIMLALVMIVGIIPLTILSASAADTTVVFELGANGSASHYDGSSKTSYSETVGDYKLSITNGVKMYTGARDAKGNSCIKLGTGSAAGSFSFTIPADVTQVIINVAGYKANAATVSVNGTATTLTTKSNDGAYDAITVDTTSTKTVNFKVTSGYRAMVNSITFVIPESSCAHANTTTTTVDATCEEAGSKTVKCNDCGNTVTYEEYEALGHNYVDDTCSRCGKTTVLTRYELVTNVASLTADDQIIIVGINENKYYAMLPYTDGNNVKTAEVSAPVDNVITLIAECEAARITLGGDNTGWTLYDGAKYYNAPGGTSDNHLKGVATLPADNTTWTISIDAEGVATIVNVGNSGSEARNTIKLNYGNDPYIFSCYKAGYTSKVALVSIYREVKEGAESCQHANTTELPEIPATCGKPGTTAGSKCNDCGNIVSGCEEIPATGEHNFVDYVCSVCGEVSLPAADSTLTIPAASAIAAAQAHNTYTSDKYYVTGVIESVTSETYGNMYIQDEAGNKILIYGVYDADGTNRYDVLEVKPVAGDTVTLYGALGSYNGTAQMKNAWLAEHIPAKVCEHANTTTTTVDATCGVAGSTTVTCDDCGETISTTEIPATGEHNYVDGVCGTCGKNENEVEATITFDDVAKRTEYTTEIQVWTENGVTVTNEKAASASNVGDYTNPARFYKGSNLTVAYPNMSKIVFNCNNATYATALEASITAETVTVTVDDTTVTVKLATPADSFAIDAMSAKVFVDSLTVYATKPAPVAPSIELTHISLDTENDALGFKAVITGYLPEGAQVGIKMSVEGGKEITYLVDASKLKTSGVVTLRLKNIMAKNGGDMKITGTPVIVMGEETVTGTAATTSMKDTILAVNELKNLNASQMAAVGMYYDNNKAAMEPWFVGADGVAIDNKIDGWYTAPTTEE